MRVGVPAGWIGSDEAEGVVAVFNYASLQEIVLMLLYWAMGLYVLTRSPRSLLSVVATATLFSVALYLLHAGLHGAIRDLAEYRAWGGKLWWNAAVAPALWYGTSVIVLHNEHEAVPAWYRRWIAYPLAALIGLAAVFFGISSVVGDLVLKWSEPVAQSQPAQVSGLWTNQAGPLFPWYSLLMVVCIVFPFGHLAWGWRRVPRETRSRPQLRWLTVSAALFVVAGIWLVTNVLVGGMPHAFGWLEPGYAFLTAGLGILAWTAVRHGTWLTDKPVRDDFFYVLSGMGVVVLLYAGLFVTVTLLGLPLNLPGLLLLFSLCLLALTTHALADVGRVTLGRLFFPEAAATQARFLRYAGQAERVRDHAALLRQAADETDQQWWYEQTERALRRLRNPHALAQQGLVTHLTTEEASPLDRARVLGDLVTASIEKLKPGDGRPAPRPYVILSEAYVSGHATKEIMNRHQIPEKTYYPRFPISNPIDDRQDCSSTSQGSPTRTGTFNSIIVVV